MKYLIAISLFMALFGCQEPSYIQVENALKGATMERIEWGGMPLSSRLLPGEMSSRITIYNNGYYDFNLPTSHRLKFYLNVNGDFVYLETKSFYELGKESELLIVVADTTGVTNPLLEDE